MVQQGSGVGGTWVFRRVHVLFNDTPGHQTSDKLNNQKDDFPTVLVKPAHLQALGQDPHVHEHISQKLTSINNSHICHVTGTISGAPFSGPVPVTA